MSELGFGLVIAFGVWLLVFSIDFIFLLPILTLIMLPAGVSLIYFGVNFHYKELNKKFSKKYYLLPILLSFIGSIIIYFGLKKSDKKVAISLAWIGIEVTIILFLMNFIIGGLIISLFA